MNRRSARIAAVLAIGGLLAAAIIHFWKTHELKDDHAALTLGHWSFIPPRQCVPVLPDTSWTRNPIDAFVITRLNSENLQPSPEAERSVLIRRLSLDLTGLPPTPDDVEAFVRDCSPQAYERVVDRLLASPHFGEKWARHWLDLARYADSDGYEQDWLRKYAFNYRDWVIQAINSDLPVDQFTILQIAGDLLPNSNRDQQSGTGFHCQTLLNREPGTDQEEFRCKEVVDRVNTTAAVWLGLTVGCAECHSHPHDPITQKEYYQLYAFFNNAEVVDRPFHTDDELAAIRARRTAWLEKSNALANKLPVVEIAAELGSMPSLPRANKISILAERKDDRHDTRVHIRGDFLQKGDRVKPGTLRALHPFSARKGPADRLDLAFWLIDPRNPLTGRVLVNQIWAHLFGRGLVSTIDDFGTHGAKPSHPELLDWLAVELQRLGWSRKELIKVIVTSASYRQSSQIREELTDRDPENLLLARQNRFRLSAEDIRDSHLAVSGLLHFKIGGPSFRPPLPTDMAAISFGFDGPKQKWDEDPPRDQYRRSLYILFQRTFPEPMLTTFDAPNAMVTCARRERSNSPLQALAALNHPLLFQCSRVLGIDLAAQSPCEPTEKIKTVFRRCLARDPEPAELQRLLIFYEQQSKLLRANPINALAITGSLDSTEGQEPAALTLLARVVMNLDEFFTRQ